MEAKVNILRSDLLKMNYYTLFKIKANYIWFAILFISSGLGAQNAIAQNGFYIWFLISFLSAIVMSFVLLNLGVVISLIFASAEKGFIGPAVYVLSNDFLKKQPKVQKLKLAGHQSVVFISLKTICLYVLMDIDCTLFPKENLPVNKSMKVFVLR